MWPVHLYAPVAEQADAPASKAVLFLQVRFLYGAPIPGRGPAGTCPQWTREVMRQDEFDKYVDKAIRRDTTACSAPAGPLPVMTPDKLARLTALLDAGRENVWYNSGDWQAAKRLTDAGVLNDT